MEISRLTHSGATLALETTTPQARDWQVGQLLRITATHDAVQGRVTLRADQQAFEALTDQAIRAGQQLQARVVSAGARPVLEILGAPGMAADPVATATLSALPRQDSMQALLANLGALARTPDSRLPADLRQAIMQAIGRLPEVGQLGSANGIRQAMEQSGLFLEALLARQAAGGPPPTLNADLKALLLRLQNALEGRLPASPTMSDGKTPPPLRDSQPHPQASQPASLTAQNTVRDIEVQLARQVDGALARIQLHQLSSLPAGEERGAMWMCELPVRHGGRTDVLHLRIDEQDPQAVAPHQHHWTVTLAFDLPGLGPVRARVSVWQDEVSTVFWAEQDQAVDHFRRYLDVLAHDFQAVGLRVADLACHPGQPPKPPSPSTSGGMSDHGLLDEQA